ncbi:MAG: hypothetical protein HQK86_05090 [Nitrospinae bacterium]|nr:hypothetical protein [Nitrospinota bacterium]MBF0634780.1 hypothetical protein [Nitrospinota bacterium]
MVNQKLQTLFEVFFTSNSLSFNVSLFFLKDGGVKNTHAEHLGDSPKKVKRHG